MAKQPLHRELEKLFGDRLYSKAYDYDLEETDLYALVDVFVRHVFKSRFSLDLVEILISTQDSNLSVCKGDCSFGNRKKPTSRYLIRVFKHPVKDNFFQIANVLAHELIHVYDYEFGRIQDILKAHNTEQLSGFFVTNTQNNQYVGHEHYDPHGKFFLEWAAKFNRLGFNVTPKYDVNMKRAMKKISEKTSTSNAKHDFFYETEDAQEMLVYKTLKHVFDLIDAPGKKFVFRSSKEWFITIP